MTMSLEHGMCLQCVIKSSKTKTTIIVTQMGTMASNRIRVPRATRRSRGKEASHVIIAPTEADKHFHVTFAVKNLKVLNCWKATCTSMTLCQDFVVPCVDRNSSNSQACADMKSRGVHRKNDSLKSFSFFFGLWLSSWGFMKDARQCNFLYLWWHFLLWITRIIMLIFYSINLLIFIHINVI